MDYVAAGRPDHEGDGGGADQRSAKRFTSLIRAAKLICCHGEFVCVLRDVSTGGVRLRCFHDLPTDKDMALELGNGDIFEMQEVRREGREASFTFADPVPVERLINERWSYPRRQLRLNLALPLTVRTLAGKTEGITENFSQQGCRIECPAVYAIEQPVYVSSEKIPEIRAKVRWRRGHNYGLVFDNTYSLRDFAMLAASLQCPGLVEE